MDLENRKEIKRLVKELRALLDKEDGDGARELGLRIVKLDNKHHVGHLFLAVAFDKCGDLNNAVKHYRIAASLKPDSDQPLVGLRKMCERWPKVLMREYIDVSVQLAHRFALSENYDMAEKTVSELMKHARTAGSKEDYKRALFTQTDESILYPVLEARLAPLDQTYTRLVELTEQTESERINKEIGERRTRLGARKEQVTAEVKREVYAESDLEKLYHNLINCLRDDERRRFYEEKLLQRSYDTLLVLLPEEKAKKREDVMNQARGMVIIKRPFLLAWHVTLEWADAESIADMDVGVLREYIEFFPDTGLAKVMKGYLESELSPFPSPTPDTDSLYSDGDDGGVPLDAFTGADRLVSMSDGIAEAKDSPLAHRLMAQFYAYLEEYEIVTDTIRRGRALLFAESAKSGLALQNSFDAMNETLATALISYQAPRYHSEAKDIFEEILRRKSLFTPAMIGIGYILEEDDQFSKAIEYFTEVLKRDPNNDRIGVELAWCKALNGEMETGLRELQSRLENLTGEQQRIRELRSLTLYRIGRCQWDLNTSKASRKDRKGPYAMFMASIKANVSFAPAYTMLGFYYLEYAVDKRRARQCFQKAFELSASEIEAAERLARSFADQGDWDVVETIAQRVIGSGKTRPPPGSKKKGQSWPHSALGVVQINRQDYQQSIVSFLAALRIGPDDYYSYVGLGESYHNSGRYNSALRTFHYAEDPGDGVVIHKPDERWFTQYMIANVNRELGQYDEAIEAYQHVRLKRSQEFGVDLAVLQTLLEYAQRCVQTGFFGRAIDNVVEALSVAQSIASYRSGAFNLWKTLADACSMFSTVQSKLELLPRKQVMDLLGKDFDTSQYKLFAEVDGIGEETFDRLVQEAEDEALDTLTLLRFSLESSILASKRAIVAVNQDVDAQAVAWYNLGWVEHRAYACLDEPKHIQASSSKYLRAAMRCFKRSIELEAGNSEFWNALGVVTAHLNPKVAQHAFVRSLHLNERNVQAWTNLATLYLLQKDYELAYNAFSRAQSTDPEYAQAWVGEGLLALVEGQEEEALNHFTHAFEIADSSSLIVKQELGKYSFKNLLMRKNTLSIDHLIQPVFALQQLYSLSANDGPYDHLYGLYNERAGRHMDAVATLEKLCNHLETEYEEREDPDVMVRFAQAKSDLARNKLATRDFDGAAADAEMALELAEQEEGVESDDMRRKIRLSAHLTTGLASYHLPDMDAALTAFRAALQDSNANPDVVCLLAQVLWAQGGDTEKLVARQQLVANLETHKGHVETVMLLAVMVTLDKDVDMAPKVKKEVERLRTREDWSDHDRHRMGDLLEFIAASGTSEGEDADVKRLDGIYHSLNLAPWESDGWRRLSSVVESSYVDDQAIETAEKSAPPMGELQAAGVAAAYAEARTAGDAQRAIMIAPWQASGWGSLAQAMEAFLG
ncbi:putative antiviral protein [Trichodelitschia bisporula]|uniref:Putative antiviral protein n=1 Tax=Trichodelitschia bisporula TaxID=703511 RepID=A0A6G1HVC6_9PEZI|nr:putative antiviral protein [Trichodelitschia bisporula]